jgi:gliding motility associated protien GldN
MKKLFVIISSVLFLGVGHFGFAQKNNTSKPPLDGVYEKKGVINREPIPYTSLREADVFWSKRVWRVIDLRQKINLPFYYPVTELKGRKSLIQIIFSGLKEGRLHAYHPLDDEFATELTYADFVRGTTKIGDSIDVLDSITGDPTGLKKANVKEFDPTEVMQFRVKEDWFFDKQRSVMDVRILGLMPVINEPKLDANGEVIDNGYKALFWVYFPECRQMFAQNEVYNRWNDAERRSFDDIFWKRLFGSYITKESNVYDRNIQSYAKDMDGLLEAERIKDDLFKFEHNLWEY